MKFKELGLSEKILSALEKIGYSEATPIQELAIPKILENKDIIGIAQTGTGKTAAFSLPIIDKLIKEDVADKKIKVLILSPTRELAIQIRDNIRAYTSETTYKCSVILGGVHQNSQIEVLKKGVDILVATPGRLLDLINQGKVNMDAIKMVVLDEADTMLDMGFIKDVKSIVKKTPKARQTLLFSATMPKEVRELSVEFMQNPVTVKTKTEEVTASKINQELYYVDKENKLNLLLDLIDSKEKPTTLIFTRTKHGANHLAEQLEHFGIKSSVIHGNKSQSNRVKALGDFKSGKNRIMIATDIAARGIDIDGLELVINFDMPEKAELYVHRIGRTARAGRDGVAISLCSSAETGELKAVEKLIQQSIKVIEHKYPMVLQEKKEARRGSNRSINSGSSRRSVERSNAGTFRKNDAKPNYKSSKKNESTSDKKRFEEKKSQFGRTASSEKSRFDSKKGPFNRTSKNGSTSSSKGRVDSKKGQLNRSNKNGTQSRNFNSTKRRSK